MSRHFSEEEVQTAKIYEKIFNRAGNLRNVTQNSTEITSQFRKNGYSQEISQLQVLAKLVAKINTSPLWVVVIWYNQFGYQYGSSLKTKTRGSI